MVSDERVGTTPVKIMMVHAHPDDEVVFTGGTLARYSDIGVETILVTATSGEEGEIHDPDLDPEEARPRLGQIRAEELRKAVEILGITHFESLGYRDSGMAETEANAHDENFHNADREEATAKLVLLVRLHHPQVMVTYDEFGAYGHPDHIMCNVITRAAFERARDPTYRPELGEPWQPLKLYYTHWPEDNWQRARQMYIDRGMKWPFWGEEEESQETHNPQADAEATEEAVIEHGGYPEEGDQAKQEEPKEEKPPAYVPPPITTRIPVADYLERKRDAIKVHRTQFGVGGPFTSMPEDIARVAMGEEDYSLVESRVPAPEQEDDLLAGILLS